MISSNFLKGTIESTLWSKTGMGKWQCSSNWNCRYTLSENSAASATTAGFRSMPDLLPMPSWQQRKENSNNVYNDAPTPCGGAEERQPARLYDGRLQRCRFYSLRGMRPRCHHVANHKGLLRIRRRAAP